MEKASGRGRKGYISLTSAQLAALSLTLLLVLNTHDAKAGLITLEPVDTGMLTITQNPFVGFGQVITYYNHFGLIESIRHRPLTVFLPSLSRGYAIYDLSTVSQIVESAAIAFSGIVSGTPLPVRIGGIANRSAEDLAQLPTDGLTNEQGRSLSRDIFEGARYGGDTASGSDPTEYNIPIGHEALQVINAETGLFAVSFAPDLPMFFDLLNAPERKLTFNSQPSLLLRTNPVPNPSTFWLILVAFGLQRARLGRRPKHNAYTPSLSTS